MKDYLRLLRRIDAWFADVRQRHPADIACTKGCDDCCRGLFDISIADRELLREGLAALDEATRRDIQARATEIVGRLRAAFAGLGDTLDGMSEDEVDRICDHLGPVPCPALGEAGECRLYEHRPLTCRLAGIPIVDLSGETITSEGCAKCRAAADSVPRLDCHELHRRELKILRRIDADRHDVTLLIPQAIARSDR